MRRHIAGTIAALGLVWSSSAGAEAANDHLIVPGERIGPLHVGMTKGEIYRAMGDPDMVIFGRYEWNESGASGRALSAKLGPDETLTEVCARAPSYSTSSGVREGMSELGVEAQLGKPAKSSKHKQQGMEGVFVENYSYPGLTVYMASTPTRIGFRVDEICVSR